MLIQLRTGKEGFFSWSVLLLCIKIGCRAGSKFLVLITELAGSITEEKDLLFMAIKALVK